MRIYRIASDETPTPPTHACVFVHDDEGWAVTWDGKDGVRLHHVDDPKGMIQWLEDLAEESDKTEAWRKWVLEGERNGWLDEVRKPDPFA